MQKQYNEIKSKYPEEIVFFRLGDFYEAFENDAVRISSVLGITLTGRGKGEKRIPMAGLPHHALDNYLPKLVAANLKVVVVDQTSLPQPGQIVEREVSRVITAGTLTDENTLSESKNNFLASIILRGSGARLEIGVAYTDITTGQVSVFSMASQVELLQELARISPSEIILTEKDKSLLDPTLVAPITFVEQGSTPEQDYAFVSKTYTTSSLKGYELEEDQIEVSALAMLFKYIVSCKIVDLNYLSSPKKFITGDYMRLNATTIRNLELLNPLRGDDHKSTVFSTLNSSKTNMGKRKLRNWILHPLLDGAKLEERWDSVEELIGKVILHSDLRDLLSSVPDLERISGRVGMSTANARDLLELKSGLDSLVDIQVKYSKELSSSRLLHLLSQINIDGELEDISSIINQSIYQDPPNDLGQGNLIAAGYNTEVDELRELRSGGKQVLMDIQDREAKRTGISSLKVAYNRVFGYYIEVTNSHKDKVPSDYIRKQTLTGSERYITEELKQWEDKILNAEDKLFSLELELFKNIRLEISEYISTILYAADTIAEVDVLASFADVSRNYDYSKPILKDGTTLDIKNGRHPVIERLLTEFTSNNLVFDSSTTFSILTGPNMSGKSTFIRQAALIVLLAQIGCFVPASKLEFGIVDQIFTRVGASDNLSQGESTFMVEMTETAQILNNSTKQSLLILDEVGRGTSTYDGVAIAWAVSEHIIKEIGARTLFATHYHELVELGTKFDSVNNLYVEVKEDSGEILFLHKISKGSADKSYGVYVAKLAGVPKEVVTRAASILEEFERGSTVPQKKTSSTSPKKISPKQISLL